MIATADPLPLSDANVVIFPKKRIFSTQMQNTYIFPSFVHTFEYEPKNGLSEPLRHDLTHCRVLRSRLQSPFRIFPSIRLHRHHVRSRQISS